MSSQEKRQSRQSNRSGQIKPSQSLQSILKKSTSRLKLDEHSEDQRKKIEWLRKRPRHKRTEFQIIVHEKRVRHGYYFRTILLFAANNLTHIMLGAVNIIVLRYAVRNNDPHAFLCTFGYHFLCAEAILSLHRVNLWSAPMYLRHRKKSHIFLQLLGILFSLVGSVITVYQRKKYANWVTLHSITGCMALLMLMVTSCFGPGAYIYTYAARIMKIVHISLALPTFVLSSLCLISGFLKPAFKKYLVTWMPTILICFVVFYTVFIFWTVFTKFVDRIRRTFKRYK